MWIYKHAFFRRDEPELLHALKRKTNQHGAPGRLGLTAGDGDDMVPLERPRVLRYVVVELLLPRGGDVVLGSERVHMVPDIEYVAENNG